MDSVTPATIVKPKRGRPSGKQPRQRIKLPDGSELILRKTLAAQLGIHDRTLRKMPLPTTILSNCAYVRRVEAIAIVLKHKTRLPPPPMKARRGRR